MDAQLIENIMLCILVPIIIISLILLLIGSARIACCNDLPLITEELDFSNLRTGDILGVGYTHPFGWFVKAWSGSTWSHTGIVWEDPNTGELFVLEAAMYTKEYSGVVKIPLVNWVRFNRKSYIGVTRLRGKKVDPMALLRAFEARQKLVKLEGYNWRWHRLLYTTPFHEETRTRYTCYEIVINTLQDVGVIKKHCTSSSYFPYHIMRGCVPLCKGYILEPVVLLDTTHHTELRQAEDKSKSRKGACMAMLTSWSSD
jgi:hypothetical protein